MTDRRWKLCRRLLLIGSVLAALKLIFFDYTLDEEYQIVMAYRRLMGDSLFGEMWEPHQTSAFACVWLMGLYHAVTGTFTGVVLYLRVVTTLICGAVSFCLCRVLRPVSGERIGFLTGLLYFNIVPKIIQIPEFSNLQVWFFTMIVLCLIRYYDSGGSGIFAGGVKHLILAGVAMALEVLAYPSCLILFPFFLWYLFRKSGEKRWRDVSLFAGVCGLCGGIWLAFVLSRVSLPDFFRNLRNVVSFDLTHELSGATAGKGAGLLHDLIRLAVLLLIAAVLAAITLFTGERLRDRRASGRAKCGVADREDAVLLKERTGNARLLIFCMLAVFFTELIQVYYWVVERSGWELPQIYLVALWIAGVAAWRYADERRSLLTAGIVGSLISFFAVMYITNLGMFYTVPHAMPGALFAGLLLVFALENTLGEPGKRWGVALLVSLCVLTVFGKGYTMRDGRDYQTVLETKNIMKYGPAAGILTDYMNAYIYNCNYEDFETYVNPGEKVLIVTNMVMSSGTTPYLFREAQICHYSVVDPTAYDERLLAYWECYPEKKPDVCVVDCWYGELKEPADNWIMRYLENDFGYTAVNDGRYVRFYRR